MRFVLDNSVTMRWLFGDGSASDTEYADHVLDLLSEEGTTALVPAIWPLEVGNVITRAEARGMLDAARGTEFVSLLAGMAIQADPESIDQSLEQTLHLARQHGLSTYDAAYLELALRKGLPLATLDACLRAAAHAAGTPDV
jgi:predicted nucleic acid-binding protein